MPTHRSLSRRWRMLAAIACLGLVAAACGDDDDTASAPDETVAEGESAGADLDEYCTTSAELDEQGLPALVDFTEEENVDEETGACPLRLLTPPAHSFLNSSFGILEKARRRESGGPVLMIHPDDSGEIESGDRVEISNRHGSVRLQAQVTTDTNRGTLVAEGTWWPSHGIGGRGINMLPPNRFTDLGGGSTFHDNRVALKKV